MQGLGNDIIEIARIREAIQKHQQHFIDRLFTLKEKQDCLTYADPAIRFAGRFAAKEATAKALGVGFGKDLLWHDIEIHNLKSGKPIVKFTQKINIRFNHPNVLISISHSKTHATAIAIWQSEDPNCAT